MSIGTVERGDGEVVTMGPMRLRVIEDGTRTQGRLALAELTIPAHVAGPPQHVHREHDETFYVLSGHPSFTSDTETTTAGPGTLVTAPPGTPHTFANPGDEPAVLLCTFTPDLYIGYFRELDGLPAGPDGRPDPRAIGELMARYATEIAPLERH